MADRAAVRRTLRWGVPAILVLAVIAWFAVRAGTATGAETDRYATTTVTTGSVTQTYAGSGTVTQVKEATATFPASATVTKVDVAVGDEVEAGDALASIDDTALKTAELEAEQTLADAQVALEDAQDAADAAASASASPTASASASRSSTGTPTRSTTSTPSPTTPSPSTAATGGTGGAGAPASGGGGTGGAGAGGLPAASLPTLATNVVEAQAALTRIEHTAALQLAAQQKACTPLSVTPSPSGSASASASTSASSSATATSSATPTGSTTPTGSASPSGTATPTASATPTTTPTATSTTSTTSATPAPTLTPSPVASVDATTLARCIAAVVTLQQTQQADAAQRTAYDTAVNALVTAASGTSQGSSPSSGSGAGSGSGGNGSGSGGAAGSGGGAASGSGGSGSASASSGSAAQSSTAGSPRTGQTTTVASAEAAVTKAQLALDSAQARLEAATMTAPISGTVAAVPFAKGDTAGSSDAVTIVGAGAVSVQMAVPEASFRLLEVGQAVTLTTPGGGTATGKVTQRGLLPDASSTTTTYPVTVTASGKAARTLPTGATASLAVTVARADDATVIPVSALTRNGSTGAVQVLADGTASRKQVTLGVVGTSTVQVTDGLAPGQVLVLADTTTPLPTTSANQGNRAFAGGGTGGPGAGGAPPGGR